MPKQRIDKGMLVMLLMVSVFFDIVQLLIDFIPVVGWGINIAIDFIATWIFWLWFKFLKVNFKNKGVLASFVGGIVLDFIPFVSALAWTADVLAVYWATCREDKKKAA